MVNKCVSLTGKKTQFRTEYYMNTFCDGYGKRTCTVHEFLVLHFSLICIPFWLFIEYMYISDFFKRCSNILNPLKLFHLSNNLLRDMTNITRTPSYSQFIEVIIWTRRVNSQPHPPHRHTKQIKSKELKAKFNSLEKLPFRCKIRYIMLY